MSQPEISPLARRLAEENNVDWRGLHGSGAGGKVVERDVLEFLARVMAGEEDLDPTPEPVPEGMEAWPETDVRSFQEEMRVSRKEVGLDEIQKELSASERNVGGAIELDDEPVVAEDDALGEDSDEISEDIFLFGEDSRDDEDELSAAPYEAAELPAEEPSRRPAFADYEDEEDEDELLVAGEDDLGDELPEAEPESGGEGPFEIGAQVAGSGDLPDVFGGDETAEDDRWHDAGAALFADEAEGAGEDLDVPPLGDVDEGAGLAGGLHGFAHDQPFAAEGTAQGAPYGAAGEPAWDGAASDEATDFDAGTAPEDDEQDAWSEVEARTPFAENPPEPEFGEPEFGEPEIGEPEFGEPEFDEAAAADASWPGEPEPQTEAPFEPPFQPQAELQPEPPAGSAGAPAAEPALDAGAAGPRVPGELPLVSYGTLLRRHVDVSALAGAQLAIGLELGEGEPLSPAPFLLRAAAKAVADAAWGEGTVAMVALDEDGSVHLRRFGDVARMPFLELVGALGGSVEAAPGPDAPVALSVVDMSALDVDEAVLSVGGPLLTLGRILYDNQRGSYRSTLSLAGEVPAERGARLLARVAELLDAPVRLLL